MPGVLDLRIQSIQDREELDAEGPEILQIFEHDDVRISSTTFHKFFSKTHTFIGSENFILLVKVNIQIIPVSTQELPN